MGEGAEDEGDFAEIYVNVGRRDGVRAADYQRTLTERAGLDRAHVRRIRVRERNAFVSVRRDDLARALAALNGASLAGKQAMAEQARDRGEAEGPDAAGAAGAQGEAASPARGGEATPESPAGVEGLVESPPVPAAEPSSDDAVPTGRSRS
jgi:ATP-dependent RNA helicase DeaD